jgi:hypothetical protein
MFGLQIVTKKKMKEIVKNAQDKALADLVEFLKNNKNKIVFGPISLDNSKVTKPMTIIGNGQIIQNCIFQGNKKTEFLLKIEDFPDFNE